MTIETELIRIIDFFQHLLFPLLCESMNLRNIKVRHSSGFSVSGKTGARRKFAKMGEERVDRNISTLWGL
jgi:hypothetical protein